jgi:outer membrane protein assembly factor BamB
MRLPSFASPFVYAFSFAFAAALLATCGSEPAGAATGQYTYHFDNNRTGWNNRETTLTTANVSSSHFGLVRTLAADSVVYAQPLYAPGILVGSVRHNLAIVASENDTVYAYDADTGKLVWIRSFTDPSQGITSVSLSSLNGCDQVSPTIGISSTPVIDPSTDILYLIDKIQVTRNGTTAYQFQMRGLDLHSGRDRIPWTAIGATVKLGDGSSQSFNPQMQNNRPGLLLANGRVYAGFGSCGDKNPAVVHGWVFAFDASTLKQVAVLNTASSSVNSTLGSVWQATFGLSADANGNLYFSTGNGSFDADTGGSDYGESVLRTDANLNVTDYFSPFDENTLSNEDQDIGSSGVMLIPDIPNSSAHLAIAGMKEGTMYLLDRDNLGRFNASADRALQEVVMRNYSDSLFGGPAYYSGTIYWCAWGEPLMSYQLNLSPTPRLALRTMTSNVFGQGGTIPSVSSNRTLAGTAIVWATTRPSKGSTIQLYAYDATNLAKTLYVGTVGTWEADKIAFLSPTIADGHVFVSGAGYGVAEFGLH